MKFKKKIKRIFEKLKFYFKVYTFQKNIRGNIGNHEFNTLIERSYQKTTFAQQGEDLVLERIIQNTLNWDLNQKKNISILAAIIHYLIQ